MTADHGAKALLLCREIAESFDSLIDVVADLDTTDDLAYVLADVRDLKSTAGEVYSHVESLLLSTMTEREVVVPGLGAVVSHRKTSRKAWDNEGLWRRIVAMARDERKVDPDSGEYEAPEEAVARVLFEVARPSWRVTPLKARGLVVDEWCQEEYGDYTIELPPRSPEERVA